MKPRFVAALLCALAFTSVSALAQQADSEIPGTYNTRTGTFHPRVELDPAVAAATPVTYAGTFVINFTLSLKSTLPVGDKVVCEVVIGVVDTATFGDNSETASAIATVSGATGTCSVKVPYSWSLASGTTDTVSLSYGATFTPTTSTAAASVLIGRSSLHTLAPFIVPKTGTTTTKAVPLTM